MKQRGRPLGVKTELTERIIGMLRAGIKPKEIAEELGIERRTVYSVQVRHCRVGVTVRTAKEKPTADKPQVLLWCDQLDISQREILETKSGYITAALQRGLFDEAINTVRELEHLLMRRRTIEEIDRTLIVDLPHPWAERWGSILGARGVRTVGEFLGRSEREFANIWHFGANSYAILSQVIRQFRQQVEE